jgi:hypothetical protein
MISTQTVFDTPTRNLLIGPWRPPFRQKYVEVIGTSLGRLKGAFIAWASTPSLPHAALWEASVIMSLLTTERVSDTPDSIAPEMPSLTDRWPRG